MNQLEEEEEEEEKIRWSVGVLPYTGQTPNSDF